MQDKESKVPSSDHRDKTEPKKKLINFKYKKSIFIGIAIILLIPVFSAVYIYAASPAVIRKPLLEHYHFRMQIVVDGRGENFAEAKYQQEYAKDQCNADLPQQPIHFHDDKDQFVHIHWEGITGGMALKYYGWNHIGGLNKALGYKLDDRKDIQKVNIHGNLLPEVPEDAEFYIYTGDQQAYREQRFEDFLNKDLEEFFGTTSNFPAHELNKQKKSLLDSIFPKAYAHGAANDTHSVDDAVVPATTEVQLPVEDQQEKLTRINNLVGNVVIFVQKDKPTDQQIKDRFNKLEPLSESTCGG